MNFLFSLLGGLGLFFFGMQNMSEGLKKLAGDKFRDFLGVITKHRVFGVLVGTFVTILVQSSSATTVMVVGFANASLLTLKQAIPVIMGANIGTTFTAWLVSSMSVFKITQYALPCIGIGFFLMTLAKTRNPKSWGRFILGFGLLFIGLNFMKDAFAPLKGSEFLINAFTHLSTHPIQGVLAGVIFTVLLQSSSATIAIVQVLAFNGVIPFEAAIPIILGDNIGTTITAQMAAVGTNINARRAAMSHTVFNLIGTAYMLIFVQMGLFQSFIDFIIPGDITTDNIMFHIAVAHSAFNVVNTLVFLPFVGILERISILLVPKTKDSIDHGTQYLEKHLLDTPSLALEQIHKENCYMLKVAHKATTQAIDSFFENDLKKVEKVIELETVTDNLQSEITQYIVNLSQRNLSEEVSEELPVLIHNVNDLERVGDLAQNLGEQTRRKVEDKLVFSQAAQEEIKKMVQELEEMFIDATQALRNQDTTTAQRVLMREKLINEMQVDFKKSHITRLNNNQCDLNSGFIFLEVINNLEKIGDRLSNIAESVIGKMKWKIKTKKVSQN